MNIDKFTISKRGVVKFIGGRSVKFTPLELHRYLQDLADSLPTKDSVIDITTPNPSVRYTDDIIELKKTL